MRWIVSPQYETRQYSTCGDMGWWGCGCDCGPYPYSLCGNVFTYPTETVPRIPMPTPYRALPRDGWTCPKCGRANAPWLPWCDCKPQTESNPYSTTFDPSVESTETT